MKFLLSLSIFFLSQTAFSASSSCTDYKKYEDLSLSEMQKIVEKKEAVILDVNSKRSFNKKHIPGAFHFKSNKGNLEKVLPKDKSGLVVTYCGGKRCLAWRSAAKAACKLGYTNVKHFSEGIKGWK